MKDLVEKYLKGICFQNVGEPEEGGQALELLKTHHVGFIVLDWMMPNLDTLELFKNVRGSDTLKEISFLMITVKYKRWEILEATRAGAMGYIIKPLAI